MPRPPLDSFMTKKRPPLSSFQTKAPQPETDVGFFSKIKSGFDIFSEPLPEKKFIKEGFKETLKPAFDIFDTWLEGLKNVGDLISPSSDLDTEDRIKIAKDAGANLKEVGGAFGRGFADTFTKLLPKSIGIATKMFAEGGSKMYTVKVVDGKYRLTREPIFDFREETREKMRKWADEVIEGVTLLQAERMKQLGITEDTPFTDPKNFAYKLASGGSSLGLAVALSIITKNQNVGALALSWLEGSDTYIEAQKNLRNKHPDWTQEQVNSRARSLAFTESVGIAFLEKFGLEALFRNYDGGRLRKAAIGAITESAQEASQEVWQNFIAKYGYDETRKIWDNVLDVLLVTLPIGFFAGGTLPNTDTQILVDSIPSEILKKVTAKAGVSEDEVREIATTVIPQVQKEIDRAGAQVQKEISEGATLNEQIARSLDEGKSPTEIAIELSTKLGTEEAKSRIAEIQATRKPIERKAVEETTKELGAISKKADESLLQRTTEELAAEQEEAQKKLAADVTKLNENVKKIQERLDRAPDRSEEKKRLKRELEVERAKVRRAERQFQQDLEETQRIREEFLADFIAKNKKIELSEEETRDVIDKTFARIRGGKARPRARLIDVMRETALELVRARTPVKKQPPAKPTEKKEEQPFVRLTEEERRKKIEELKKRGKELEEKRNREHELGRLQQREKDIVEAIKRGVPDTYGELEVVRKQIAELEKQANEAEKEEKKLEKLEKLDELQEKELAKKSDEELLKAREQIIKEDPNLETMEATFDSINVELEKRGLIDLETGELKEKKQTEIPKEKEKEKPETKEEEKPTAKPQPKKFTAWKRLMRGNTAIKTKTSWGTQLFQSKANIPEVIKNLKWELKETTLEELAEGEQRAATLIGTTENGKLAVFEGDFGRVLFNKEYIDALTTLHPNAETVLIGDDVDRPKIGFKMGEEIRAVVMGVVGDIGEVTPLPKAGEGGKIKDDEKDIRGGRPPGQKELPETIPTGGKRPREGGEDTGREREGARRNDGQRRSQFRERLRNERLTEAEVREAVEFVTDIKDGEVVITGDITDDIRETASRYEPAGKRKDGRGILDEYYTNSRIVDLVKSLFDFGGDLKVLEPSVGTGNFLWALPDTGKQNTTAYEVNELTARIAKIFHPDVTVRNEAFETIFIDERGNAKEFTRDYDLVLGNPPYGEHRGKYIGLGEEPHIKKYEDYFVKRGLDLLKKGGHLAMVLPSSFLRSSENRTKINIAGVATLVTAFRLPNGVFEGTDIGTDIVIFKKGRNLTDVSSMVNDNYFKENPSHVLGKTRKRKDRFGKMVDVVEGTLEDAITAFYEQRHEDEAIRLVKEMGLPQTQENIENAEAAIEETGNATKAKKLAEAEKRGKKIIKEKISKKATPIGETMTLDTQFEGEFTEQELAYWKATQPDGSLDIPESEIDQTIANKFRGKWYNDFNYAKGDIYEKLDALEKEDISDEQRERQRSKLLAVLPRAESVDDIKLSPNTEFVKNLKIDDDKTLRSAFLEWMQDLPRAAFGDSSSHEVREYTTNQQVRGNDKAMNERIRVRRKRVADDLMQKFLKDLDSQEADIVKDAYNRTFNFWHTPDYRKVPMFSTVASTFKNAPFSLNEPQKQAIGRLVTEGIGIIQHGVGVGKTISGIIAIHEQITRGWIKKPLIVVPSDAMAKQWIEGHILKLVPNAKVNYLGNLGKDYVGDLSTLKIDDGSYTVVTYEGLERISFKDETYNRFSKKFGYIQDDLEKHKTKRDKEKDDARDETTAGLLKQGTREDIFFEDLGFDHLTYDEVQNANHIVSKVKLPSGHASEFSRFHQRFSHRGIIAWLTAQYIQENNNGRNVSLLSATPFTNHPLEYYSILSLVADSSLQKMGFRNVNEFFGQFMEASNEYEFKADGSYQRKTDIRGFKNYRQFRKLLDTYIDFRESNQKKPNLVIRTYNIPANQFVLDMEEKAQAIFREDVDNGGKGAKALRAIEELRNIAFSPYASQFSAPPPNYKDFVENSPKLKTFVELLRQNKKDEPEAGNVVYFDKYGKKFIPLLKTYLVRELGYKENEVEIYTGATPKAKRPMIQKRFNDGEIKVLLGSKVIGEGIELQGNSTDMFLLALPWNFTALEQVQGRIWRQGNKWENVRMSYLFMEDSVDIFSSQKLQNKQERYNAAINSNAQEVEMAVVTYEEVKFDLVKDPETRAKLEVSAEKERVQNELTQTQAELAFATRKFDKLSEIQEKITEAEEAVASERILQGEAERKGEEFDTWWLDKNAKEATKLRKEYKAELEKLAAKGIDIAELKRKQERGQAEISKLQEQLTEIENDFKDRVKRIAESLPKRVPFSEAIVREFVNERAEHNKTFYEKRDRTQTKLAVETKTKEIKNAAGTKVVKRKTETKLKKTNTRDERIESIITDSSLTVEERIDLALKEKQAGKDFKDVGERVAGSRKERAITKIIMESGDKAVMREFVKRVGLDAINLMYDKHSILENAKKPNPEQDKKDGVPSYVAYIKKDILDKIPNKFSLNVKQGRWRTWSATIKNDRYIEGVSTRPEHAEYLQTVLSEYPEILQEFVGKLADVKTFEELAQFWTWFEETYEHEKTQKKIKAPDGTEISIESGIFGTRIVNYDTELPIGQFTFRSKTNPRMLFQIYKNDLNEEDPKKRADYEKAWDELLNRESWWTKIFKKNRGTREETELRHGNFAPLAHIERSAPPIPAEKVNAETLTKYYGFKSVQLGNYMDDDTSREHIRHAIGAIEDLTNLLQIDFPSIINKTGLSIAFGARGGGGFAVAHYEPVANIINITKKRGDGSFGHEFMHFLDAKTADRYAGKWSSKKHNWFLSDSSFGSARVALMQGLTGEKGHKVKEFLPSDDPYISDDNPVVKWRREGMSFEDAVKKAAQGIYYWRGTTKVYEHTEGDLLQYVADIYRKPILHKVPFWHEETTYYKNSKNYGGKYWSKPEELLARAFQAYIEDKMADAGMKNNYLTRSSIAPDENSALAKTYPQGEERKRFNQLFDDVFELLRNKFPLTAQKTQEARFRAKNGELADTNGTEFLRDIKERLKLDFDVRFVETILGTDINRFSKKKAQFEAWGATLDNTIALTREMAAFTAEHEIVHLTMANLEKIPIFKRNGITKEKLIKARREKMAAEKTDAEIEEQIARDFEEYVANRHTPKGILAKFFRLLKQLLQRFVRVALQTDGDIITNYYDILLEGEAVEEEMVRLENQGIMESFIEDDVLRVRDITFEARRRTFDPKIKPMETEKAREIVEELRRAPDPYAQKVIIDKLSEQELGALMRTSEFINAQGLISDDVIGYAMDIVYGRVEPQYKLKEEGDKRFRNLQQEYNTLADKQEQLEQNINAWRSSLEQEIIRQHALAELVDEARDERITGKFGEVGLIRHVTKEGTLTERGVVEAENLGFANKEEAERAIAEYLKRKNEAVQSRIELNALRSQIATASKDKRTEAAKLSDIGRKLKLRAAYLDRKAIHVNMGMKRGKRKTMHMLWKRGRAIRNAQDAFEISDKEAKQIIGELGRQKIYLMSNSEFEDFMLKFAEKAQKIRATLDARIIAEAIITENRYGKWENLLRAMGLPAISKMNEEQANRFVAALEKYQFGDVFLTQRQIETVHRSKWGDIKTERELFDKMGEIMGFGREEMKNLTAPKNQGAFTPWLRLARIHPFFNWLVSRRIEAKIQEEREYFKIEKQINTLTRAARSSRRKKMGLAKRVADVFAPMDEIVFGYMEASDKETYRKEKDMTPQELALADYLTTQFFVAYNYLKSEYGVRNRKNYMTHVRRSFFEALRQSGIKNAIGELFTSQREEEVAFNIVNDTGEILAYEKFFPFAIRRSGKLVPSKNIARASLAYFRALARKRALDAFVPEAMVVVRAYESIKGKTPRGLSRDPSIRGFVKKYVNDAKGRKIDIPGFGQGSTNDILLRALTTWVAVKYLGLNLATAVANFIGDFVVVFWELKLSETARGIVRSFQLPTVHEVNKKFRFFTGRNPIVELFDPQYNVPSRFLKALMVLMSLSNFQSQKFFLRAKMTEEEWNTKVVGDKRLIEIAKSLSRAKPNPFYIRSLVGNTTIGRANFQFGTWAVAVFNTFVSDSHEVIKMLGKKKTWDVLTSDEAAQVAKFVIMGGIAAFLVSLMSGEDDDDENYLTRRAKQELTTLYQAVEFVTDPSNYMLAVKEIALWASAVRQLIRMEQYKTDGIGYGIGDLRGWRTLKRAITPSAIKNFFPEEGRIRTPEKEVEKAIQSGEFDAEKIVDFAFANELKEREGKALTEYRKKKIGEITVLYNLRKRHTGETAKRISEIVLYENPDGGSQTNAERVRLLVEYEKEKGKIVYDEVLKLYRDNKLCAGMAQSPRKRTGCLISKELLREYQRSRRK